MKRGMLTMKATFAAAEREAAQERTREAMRGKASHGHVAGGKVYGYRNVRLNGHVTREIEPEQAAVIRRIFELVGQGRGFAKVAKTLNAEQVPCPTGRHWAMTGVRDLYRGRIVYGKTRNTYRRGRRGKVSAPESEWISVRATVIVEVKNFGAFCGRMRSVLNDPLRRPVMQTTTSELTGEVRVTNAEVFARRRAFVAALVAAEGEVATQTWKLPARAQRVRVTEIRAELAALATGDDALESELT